MRALLAAVALIVPASVAGAHQLNLFASVTCDVVTIEAKFANGRVVSNGEVNVFGAEDKLIKTMEMGPGGIIEMPLEGIDHSAGLFIEIKTSGHDDYWIVTPEDIARKCGS